MPLRLQRRLALTDEQAWERAGISDAEGIRLCWNAGFDPSNIQEWISAVLYTLRDGDENTNSPLTGLVVTAQTWRVAGFTPEQARAWSRVGLNIENAADLVQEARRWRAAGFDPNSAGSWRQGGVVEDGQDLEFAVLFANQNWHPMQAALLGILLRRYEDAEHDQRRRDWLALELGPEKTLNYVKAGVTSEQAKAFESLNLQPSTLEAELQTRYKQLPPLDTFLAMCFNHICYGDGRDERPDEDLPFYARHMRDLHDDRREREEQADHAEWQNAANSAGQRLVAVVESRGRRQRGHGRSGGVHHASVGYTGSGGGRVQAQRSDSRAGAAWLSLRRHRPGRARVCGHHRGRAWIRVLR